MSAQNSTAVVNPREQRGQRIASRYKLKPNGSIWSVPSESSNDRYKVDPETGRCTCPDSNEALLKVLCHNICVLVQSIYELDIAPVFWGNKASVTASA